MSTFSTSSRQKRLQTLQFLHIWLRNVLRATTACTFPTSELQKVVRDRQFITLLTWKCASRHNGVQFFDIWTSKSGPRLPVFNTFDLEMCFAPQRRAIFHLSSGWLRTRRFSEPTFRPSGATNHWKNTVFRDFPTFSRICIFFLLILSLLTLLTSAFQLSILSEDVGSFTSKLPSIKLILTSSTAQGGGGSFRIGNL